MAILHHLTMTAEQQIRRVALLRCVLEDAKTNTGDLAARHFLELGETTRENKIHADYLRACLASIDLALVEIDKIQPPAP